MTSDARAGYELLDIARAEYRNGSVRSAWKAALEAASIGRELGDARLLADAALVITAPSVGAWDLTAQRHALCREALALIGDRDEARADRLRALIAVTRSPWQHSPSGETDTVTMERAESLSAELHARHSAATGAAGVESRLACADELAGFAAATGRDEDAAWASLWRLDAYCQLGRRLELNAEMMTLAASVRRLGSPAWRWRLAAARASVALLDGHLADLPALAEEALRLGGVAGIEDAAFVDLILRSSIAVQTRTGLDDIEHEVRRALAGAPFSAHGWHAHVLLSMGRTAGALTIWRALAPRLRDLPVDSLEWLVASASSAELCAAADDTAAATYLMDLLLPYADQHVTGGILTPYEGPVSLYLGKLAVALGDHTAARHYFTTAATLSDRMHAPLYAAASRRALDTLGDLASPLTLREQDVARLVADGLSNRQIASRLTLSERTVENHVGHILRKLDTPTRAGIAAHITRRTSTPLA